MPKARRAAPRFGAPLGILVAAAALYLGGALGGYERPVLLVLAAGFGWKLAEHLHAWPVVAPDAPALAPGAAARARLRALLGAVAYAAAAALGVLVLTG